MRWELTNRNKSVRSSAKTLTEEARRRSGHVARLASAANGLGDLRDLGSALAFTLALAVAIVVPVSRVARVSSASVVVRQTAAGAAVAGVAGVGTVVRQAAKPAVPRAAGAALAVVLVASGVLRVRRVVVGQTTTAQDPAVVLREVPGLGRVAAPDGKPAPPSASRAAVVRRRVVVQTTGRADVARVALGRTTGEPVGGLDTRDAVTAGLGAPCVRKQGVEARNKGSGGAKVVGGISEAVTPCHATKAVSNTRGKVGVALRRIRRPKRLHVHVPSSKLSAENPSPESLESSRESPPL